MRRHPTVKSAFTLLEMSIVLVVVGLLIGVLFSGKTMLRSAKMTMMIADVQKLKTAINTFTIKYGCLPGDCAHASDFFGGVNHACPWPDATATGACNGNGDGNYYPWFQESVSSFDHLYRANLWIGANTSGTASAIRGMDVDTWAYIYTNDLYGQVPIDHRIDNMIETGAQSGGCLHGYTLNVMDSQQVDGKLDDGYASTGEVLGVAGAERGADFGAQGCGLMIYSCLNANGDYDTLNPTTGLCRMLYYF